MGQHVVVIKDIIWLDRIVEKLAWKHNVLPSEVEEVFSGGCRIFRKEKGKVEGEHLYNALGRSKSGRYLSIFFIKKLGNRALIVTARGMNGAERRRYGQKS
jgi:uncharacterized protein